MTSRSTSSTSVDTGAIALLGTCKSSVVFPRSSRLQDFPWFSKPWSNSQGILDASPHFQRLAAATQGWELYAKSSLIWRSTRIWLNLEQEPSCGPSKGSPPWRHVAILTLYRLFDMSCIPEHGSSERIKEKVMYTANDKVPIIPVFMNDWCDLMVELANIADQIVDAGGHTVIQEQGDPEDDFARILNFVGTSLQKFPLRAVQLLHNFHAASIHLAYLLRCGFLAHEPNSVPDWYDVGKNKDKEAKTRYPLQLAALISPIFLAVMDPQLAGTLKFNPNIMMEYSERLGNIKIALIRDIENSFWRVLFRIASREIGVVGGIKELVSQLPMDAICKQSLVQRHWFNLLPEGYVPKKSAKMKRTIPRTITTLRDTSSTTSEIEGTSQLPGETASIPSNTETVPERADARIRDEVVQPARVQRILLQSPLPSLSPISVTCSLQSDTRNTPDFPSGLQCNVPAYTAKGEKAQYFFSVQEPFALRIDRWLGALFHGLQAGRPLYLGPEETRRSGLVVLTYNDVADTKSIQRVLTDKCVILVDEPDSGFIFDRLSLSHFCPIKSKIVIRDHSRFPVESYIGTLNDVIEASSISNSRLLSTENLPLHEGTTTMSSISSDNATWRATKGLPLCAPDEVFPLTHIRGAYVSTKGVLTDLQIAQDGLGMVMNVECGALWVISAFPIERETGFFLSTFGAAFSVDHPDTTKWVYEAVLLAPGMKLVIRPNTLYASIALENTLYTVDNFYATSTLTDTLAGLAHAICSPYMTKSVSTSSSCLLLQRYVICLHAAFVLDEIDEIDPVKDHLPNVLTPGGCSNFFAACVIGILLDIFDWSSYPHRHNHNGSSSNHEQDRYAHVRKLGYETLQWFFLNHSVECDGSSSTPIDFTGPEPSHQILKLIGHFLSGIQSSITPPSEGHTGDHAKLTVELLDTIVGKTFPLDQREGTIVRGAYEDECGGQVRLDFICKNWRVARNDPPNLPLCDPNDDLDSF